MRTALYETPTRTRVVAGNVTSIGLVKKGVGFSCYKASTGVYAVSWTFPVKRAIAITAEIYAATAGFAIVDPNWGSAAIIVRTFNTAFAAADLEFGFTAIVLFG